MNKTIGIVTVLYNSEEVIDDFFASLARQVGVSFRLYVIDNSPLPTGTDRCRTLALQYSIDAKLVFNGENVGFAKGSNQGIECALRDGCAYVLLANNDINFSGDTLHDLLQPMLSGELISTPKILYYGSERLIWYAGGRIDPWTLRVPHFGMRERDHGQYDVGGYTQFAPACFMMLDVTIFHRVGLFDERYFVYYEDVDFVWRIIHAGLRICYVPEAVVEHKVSTLTGGGCSPFTLYYSNRNRIYFIRKNLKRTRKVFALSYVLVTRLLNSLRLKKSDAGHLWAGVKDGFRVSVTTDGV